jgi:hypothetical protein
VTLINTKGMAFFGPGSEWFWAALQFSALAITFVAIYRQLRIARSQRAVELVNELRRQFEDERMFSPSARDPRRRPRQDRDPRRVRDDHCQLL